MTERFTIGQEIGALHRQVTQEKICAFAEASHDYNPIHLNPEFAKANTPYGGTIAHGLMTFSFMQQVFTHWVFPQKGFLKQFQAKFVKPVKPGDGITARGVISEVTRNAEQTLVTCDFTAVNQRGETVAVGKGIASFE